MVHLEPESRDNSFNLAVAFGGIDLLAMPPPPVPPRRRRRRVQNYDQQIELTDDDIREGLADTSDISHPLKRVEPVVDPLVKLLGIESELFMTDCKFVSLLLLLDFSDRRSL